MSITAVDTGIGLQSEPVLQLEIHADPTVSYASYQNNVPLGHSLTLTNATVEPLHGVELIVRCEPTLADPMHLRLERLDARETRKCAALRASLRLTSPRSRERPW